MRLANLSGRAVLVAGDAEALDVHKASDGRFGPELRGIYDNWTDFVGWAGQAGLDGAEPFDVADLGAPSPEPRQIFAIGLNYSAHAAESGFEAPTDLPPVFPKFQSSLSGPVTEVVLPAGGNTDWEVELVAVIGREVTRVAEADAWDVVAGLTVGNDISERVVQLRGPAPQFGLGKSFPGFSPTGPWLVTTDELDDRDNLTLTCTLDDEVVQDGRTSELIMSVPRLIAELTKVVTLYPGDLIFTGTPAGVGVGREPQLFVAAGQTLVSSIEGIGELRQTFVPEETP
ncbi:MULTISPECIES: fumarylacetoacetate hydrolase family protein [unclassified Nocardioides]|uniref:fumarylacetoacetate hydrolase family protein n=1 Tax=unclassified Nocardioides TaxID=2615069 RepID=UPI0006F59576|nr:MULTISPECIES: fumarylacetoacetate hydrolase family protein [unclassified Nocardioides]KQY56518.1 fumarylacetoacetate hydrolase [Nocardioides sp. Root140]KQZ75274.1 fumarylacetoacetate hydrolase [Nocardioides sp. Root151]KRF14354.1 fumarylacetoacetate hydrolase [Nocardioides sp. Soil796]